MDSVAASVESSDWDDVSGSEVCTDDDDAASYADDDVDDDGVGV